MTLIYAEQRESLIYILADTFWASNHLQGLPAWKLDPLVKIIALDNDLVIAYAGNSTHAENAICKIVGEGNSDAHSVLLDAHKKSRLSGDEEDVVDFLLARQASMTLTQIKDGTMQTGLSCFLGSKANFGRFQTLRHNGVEPRPDASSMNIVKIPENCSEEDGARYSAAVVAFQATIQAPLNDECGGFCVPYLITPLDRSFQTYLENYRGPVDSTELGLDGTGAIPHNDLYNGGYQLIFSGNETGFSGHFVNGNYAFIHHNFGKNLLTTEKVIGQDPYDIAHKIFSAGIAAAIDSWSNPQNDTWKIQQLITNKDFARAEELICTSLKALLRRVTKGEPSSNLNFENGVIGLLKTGTETSYSIGDVNHISFLIEARRKLYDQWGPENEAAATKKEMNTWMQFIENSKFHISINDIPMNSR